MDGIFNRPIDQLEERELRDLVDTRRVREHAHLDYKATAYEHSHSQAVEMLADVTAMANAQGGYILLGVTESEGEPDGTPSELVGVENGGDEEQWIQNTCLSSIDEKLVGLRVRAVPLANRRTCIVIQVPNSPRKPHGIVHQNHRSFRLRQGRDKSFMSTAEVRNMVLNINSYRTTLAGFLDERSKAAQQLAGPTPWALYMATPIYVDADIVDPLRPDIKALLSRPPGNPDASFIGIYCGNPRPTLWGAEAVQRIGATNAQVTQFLRLFRNGHLEFGESHGTHTPAEWPQAPMRVQSSRLTVQLIQFLTAAQSIFAVAEVQSPVAVTAELLNFCPSYLRAFPREDAFIEDSAVLREPQLKISLQVTELENPQDVARAIIGRLFNAYGFERNPHFNPDGTYRPWRY